MQSHIIKLQARPTRPIALVVFTPDVPNCFINTAAQVLVARVGEKTGNIVFWLKAGS